MKRFLFCLLAMALFWSCHPRSEGPRRIIECGIEVADEGTGVYPPENENLFRKSTTAPTNILKE